MTDAIVFLIGRTDDGWQINGDGDIYATVNDAHDAICHHAFAKGIRDYTIAMDDA